MQSRLFAAAGLLVVVASVTPGCGVAAGQSRAGSAAAPGAGVISEQELREHLTYLASDALEGRAAYTEGLGLAASYIAQHLKAWGVEPGGDAGTYFQRVPSYGVRTTRG